MSISDYFADDDEDFPLGFIDALGEHALPDNVKHALMWASINRFMLEENVDASLVESSEFSTADKKLAKHVVFHGPFTDIEEAVNYSKDRVGIVVAPKIQWKPDAFVFVAVLAN